MVFVKRYIQSGVSAEIIHISQITLLQLQAVYINISFALLTGTVKPTQSPAGVSGVAVTSYSASQALTADVVSSLGATNAAAYRER